MTALVGLGLTSVAQETAEDYVPYTRSRYGTQIFSVQSGRPGVLVSQGAVADMRDYWGTPTTWGTDATAVELYDIKKGANSLVWLRGYSPFSKAYAPAYPVRQIRAELEFVNSPGLVFDITSWHNSEPQRPNGHPYMLYNVYRNQPYVLRVWGEIWSLNAPAAKFYWEARYTFGVKTNPIWQLASKTRDCIIQEELWWDNNGTPSAWAVGGADNLPFDAQGNPQRLVNSWYGRKVYDAKGAGIAWVIENLNKQRQITDVYAMYHWWNF